ncbi:hypothetical protein GCM10023144_08420 [Pigmentiphaga soli]|uniref:DUF4347 domain-containing protein n=1 Tax=Pigmentiphaga soli TaxID=1007095 RepID=A0ABP8GJX2_9BURK
MQFSARSRRPRSHRYALESRQLFDGAALVEAAAAAPAHWEPPAEVHQADAPAPADAPAAHGDAPADAGRAAPAAHDAERHAEGAAPAADTGRHEVYAIDEHVADWQSIVASLPPGAEIVLLDGQSSGLAQLAGALAGRHDIDALHIISHGSAGEITLGNAKIDGDNVASFAAQWAAIGASLGGDGDIMLYGCDVARDGTAFLQQIADLTGADVAASSDPVGAAALGGDWVMESSVGRIETAAWADADYAALLAAPAVGAARDEVRVIEPSTLNAPGAETYAFDGFWTVAGDGEVTVTAQLSDPAVGALAATVGGGTETGGVWTFTGTAAEARDWLNGLTFTAADVELGISAASTTLGVHIENSGDPALAADRSVTLTVTPSNDPATLADTELHADEVSAGTDNPTTVTADVLAIVDPEVAAGTQIPSQIVYRLIDGSGDDLAYGYLTLRGQRIGVGSIFTQQDVIDGLLVYHHTATGADQDSDDAFSVSVNDGATPQANSDTARIAIKITPVNQAPNVEGGGPVYEGQPANARDRSGTLQSVVGNLIEADGGGDDADADLTVEITALPTHGTLYFDGVAITAAGFTFNYSERGRLTYSNDGLDNPATGTPPSDSFGVTVTDNGGGLDPILDAKSASTVIALTIRPVDDNPEWVDGSSLSATVGGDLKVTLDTSMVDVTDIDSTDVNLTFVVTAQDAARGMLMYVGADGTETLGVGATFTLADVKAGRVQFWQTAAAGAGETAAFDFQVVDNAVGLRWRADGSSYEQVGGIYESGAEGAALRTFTFTVNLLESAQGADLDGTTPRDTSSQTADDNKNVSGGDGNGGGSLGGTPVDEGGGTPPSYPADPTDPGDPPTVLYEGGTLVIGNGKEGQPAGLSYSMPGVDPSQVVYTILAEGTEEHGWHGNLQKLVGATWVTLYNYDTFTQADLDNGRVRFVHDGGEQFQSTVRLQASAGVMVDDGAGGVQPDRWNVDLTFVAKPVNDRPVVSGSTTVITEADDQATDEANAVAITSGMLGFADPDDGNSGNYLENAGATLPDGTPNYAVDNGAAGGDPLRFVIVDLPDHGKLQYWNGSAWVDVQAATRDPDSGTLDLHDATVLDASWITGDAGTTRLRYVNDGSEYRSDAFQVVAMDRWFGDGTTDPATTSSAPATVGFTITNRNDPPRIAADPNQTDPTGAFPYETDAGGNPIDPDAPPAIDDTGLNDALRLVYEGSYGRIDATMLQAIDPDSSDRQVQYRITAAPEHGRIAYSVDGHTFLTIGVGSSFSQADVAAGRIYYLSDGSDPTGAPYPGTPSDDHFEFTLADGASEQTGREFWIYVNPTNDAPVVSAPSGPIPVTDDLLDVKDGSGKAFSVSDPDLTTLEPDERDFIQVTVRLLKDDGSAFDQADYAAMGGVDILVGSDYTLLIDGHTEDGEDTEDGHDGNNDFLVLRGTREAVNNALATLQIAFHGDRDQIYQVQVIADDRMRDPDGSLTVMGTDPDTGDTLYGGNGGGVYNQPSTLYTGEKTLVQGDEFDWYSDAVPTSGDIRGNISAASVTIWASTENDPVTLGNEAGAATVEDQATFIGDQLNFSIGDTESQVFGTSVTVTLSVASGELDVGSAAGVGVVRGTGTLTLTGTAADIQDLLNSSLTYRGAADVNHDLNGAADGDVTLTVTVSDASGSNLGDGQTPTSVSHDIALTIQAVNDAPTVTAGSGSLPLTGETPVPGFSVHDRDVDGSDGDGEAEGEHDFIQVTVRLTQANGSPLTTAGSNDYAGIRIVSQADPTDYAGLIVDGTYTGVDSALVIRGSVEQVNAFLAKLAVDFSGSSLANSDTHYRVQVIADDRMRDPATGALAGTDANGGPNADGSGTGTVNVPGAAVDPYGALPSLPDNVASAYRDIFPTDVNDPARIDADVPVFTEGSATVALSGLAVSDSDALPGDILTATVTLPQGFTIASVSGTVAQRGTLTGVGSGELVISGTLDQINYALNHLSVGLPNIDGTPAATDWNGQFDVTVRVDDGGNNGGRPGTVSGGDPASDPGSVDYADPGADQPGVPDEALVTTRTFTVTVSEVNDAPVVVGNTEVFDNESGPKVVLEDSTPAGQTVGDLFGSHFSDPNDDIEGKGLEGGGAVPGSEPGSSSTPNGLAGVAIIGLTTDSDQGVWQYNLDPGNPAGWTEVGDRSAADALYLGAGAALRFVPNGDFHGTPQAMTVVLVEDGGSGLPASGTGGLDLSSGNRGATTRYSSGTITLSTTVDNLNDSPVIGNETMPAVDEDDTDSSGHTVGSLFPSYSDDTDDQTDVDGGGDASTPLGGIAIVGNTSDPLQGVWQYSHDDGGSWTDIPSGAGSPDGANAIVLGLTDLLRFVPAANFNGAPDGGLVVRASDTAVTFSAGTDITGQLVADADGESHWSGAQTLGTTVIPLNDAPVLGGDPTDPTVTENTGLGTGVPDTQLADNVTLQDVDIGTTGGVAVFGAGTITVRLTDWFAGDVLNVSGLPTGVFATYEGDTLTIQLAEDTTLADVQNLIEAVRYSSTSDNPTNYGAHATRSYQIQVFDGNNAQSTGDAGGPTGLASATIDGTLTIIARNDPPQAHADTNDIDEDTASVSGQVVDGDGKGGVADTDPDSLDLTVTGAHVGDGAAPDTPVTAGSVTLVGLYGTLVLQDDGSYVYTLDNDNADVNALKDGDHLDDVFSYTITDGDADDGDGNTSSATLTITIHGNTDGNPVIVPDDGNSGAGQATVEEHGLVDASGADVTSGTVTITAGDGLTSITVGGTTLDRAALAGLSVAHPVDIDTGKGILHLTGFTDVLEVGGVPVSGTLAYTYELKQAQNQPNATSTLDNILLAIDDEGSGHGTGTLSIQIVDDTPTAHGDGAEVNEDDPGHTTASGNVVDGGANADVADDFGADGAATDPVTGIRNSGGTSGTLGSSLAGLYGGLVMNADGTYTYTLENDNAAVNALKTGESRTDTFTYEISDADGDKTTATLTITIHGHTDGGPSFAVEDVNTGSVDGDNDVLESDLVDDPDGAKASGTIDVDTPDGLASITVGGTEVTLAQLLALTSSATRDIDTGEGILKLTGFTPGSQVGGVPVTGTLSYTYVLKAARSQPGAVDSFDDISIQVKDAGNVSSAAGTLSIRIVDDTPTANDDAVSIGEETAQITGNVIAGGKPGEAADRVGADTGTVTSIAFDASAPGVGTRFETAYGHLTLNADGSYTYELDSDNADVNKLKDGDTLTEVFGYTLTDGDGDTDSATLTITIQGHTDGAPTIDPVDGNAGADGHATVEEHGLVDASGADVTSGTVAIAAGDGLASITVGGTTLDTAALAALSAANPVDIDTGKGILHLTGFTGVVSVGEVPVSGTLTYTYQLKAALDQEGETATPDDIALSIEDVDGIQGSGTLRINIVDDTPTAHADGAEVTEDDDDHGSVSGNVVDGGANDDAADDFGADGKGSGPVTAIENGSGAAGTLGAALAGQYGALVMNADGTYTYTLDNGNPDVNALKTGDSLTDTFTYTITDGDGDTVSTTLTITIAGHTDGNPDITPDDGNGSGVAGHIDVYEKGLADADGSNVATGTMDIEAADGLTSVTVDGRTVTLAELQGLGTTEIVIETANYKITLTGFDSDVNGGGIVVGGTLHYSYELKTAPAVAGTDTTADIAVSVTDAGDATANGTLTVRIIDDAPTARADEADVTEDGTPAMGNVLGGMAAGDGDVADRVGADGSAVTGVAAGDSSGVAVNGNVDGDVAGGYGTLVLGADGDYIYTLDEGNADVNALKTGESLTDTFSYTITDADGDTSTTTLTITIHGHTDGAPAITPVDGNGSGVAGHVDVYEKGLADADGSNVATGTLDIEAADGLTSVTVDGRTVTLAELANLGTTQVVIDTANYKITLTGFDSDVNGGGIVVGGTLHYSYELKTAPAVAGADTTADIAVSVTDAGDATSIGTLTVRIIDDAPTARADEADVTEDGTPAMGNVLGGMAAGDGDVADRVGADGSAVTGVAAGDSSGVAVNGNVDGDVAGGYGTLVLGADGNYTYTLDEGNADVNALKTGESLTDTFSYTITDADGDTSTTTLTITIHGNTDGNPAIVPVDGNGSGVAGHVDVYEKGLADADGSNVATGTMDIEAADGLTSVTVDGRTMTLTELQGLGTTEVVIDTANYKITLTGFDSDVNGGGIVVGGTLHYSYELKTAPAVAGVDTTADIAVSVTDAGDATTNGTLTVRIIDDAPTARADEADVTEDGTPVMGNVLGGMAAGDGDVADRLGADGDASDAVTGVAAGDSSGVTVNGDVGNDVVGSYGTLVLGADGNYTYTLDEGNADVNALKTGESLKDTFSYTITDADGDISTTTLTITIHGNTDGNPAIVPVDGNGASATGEAEVYEHGLTDASGTQTTTGDVTIQAADGLTEVVVAGQTLSLADLAALSEAAPRTITTSAGTLALIGFEATANVGGVPTAGTLHYRYTLSDAQTHASPGADENTDIFALEVHDAGGGSNTGTLTVRIVDDVPTAAADTADVNEDSIPATGNVLGDTGAGAGDHADRLGADGAAAGGAVTGVAAGDSGGIDVAGSVGSNVAGNYGTLVLDANGGYAYTVANTNPAVNALKDGDTLTEVFTYTITDADGDTSTTTLTVTIHGHTDGNPAVVPVDGNGASATGEAEVYEHGLTDASAAQTTTGDVTIQAADGLDGVVINGQSVSLAVLQGLSESSTVTITTAMGAMALTGFEATATVGGVPTAGVLHYRYTITDPQTHGSAGEDEVTDVFALEVHDAGGDSSTGTLTVRIVDDVPTAVADTADVDEDSTPATGNVLGDTDAGAGDHADRLGADGAAAGGAVTGVQFGAAPDDVSGSIGTGVAGSYGTLVLNADGGYTYTVNDANPLVNALKTGDTLTEVFSYTITDHDGDTSTTTLTITIHGNTDGNPAIVPVDGNGASATGEAEVYEHGLTDASETQTTTGDVTIQAADGLTEVVVAGQTLSLADLAALSEAAPRTITTSAGTLALIGFEATANVGGAPTAGTLHYRYTLSDAQTHASPGADENTDTFALEVHDAGGGSNTGTLTVRIVDDVPTAAADTADVNEDSIPATGNVLGDTGAGAGDHADRLGADGAAAGGAVTGVQFGAAPGDVSGGVGTSLAGGYGTLVLNANGGYAYTVNDANPAVNALKDGDTLTEVFTYTITDHDGDTSTTTLTITIHGHTDGPPAIVPVDGNAGATGHADVNEHGLTDPGDPSEETGGTIDVISPDGLQSIDVNGIPVTLAQLLDLDGTPQTIVTPKGTLVLDGFDVTSDVGGIPTAGTLHYHYTLDAPQNQPDADESTDDIALTVTDQGGGASTGTLTIRIVDDTPDARDDEGHVNEDATGIDGNVIAAGGPSDVADVPGADGAAVSGVTFGGAPQTVGGAGFDTAHGHLALNADGSYHYELNNDDPAVNALKDGDTLTEQFVYTLTDGDGDTDTATLTITIHGRTDGNPSIVPIDGAGAVLGDADVDEHALTDPADPGESTTGRIDIEAADGLQSITVGGTSISLAQLSALDPGHPIVIDTPDGTLTLTGFTPGPLVGGIPTGGVLDYRYTLDGPVDQPGADATMDSIALSVTDQSGATIDGALTIRIVDDAPVARPDTTQVDANPPGGTVSGNVVAGDAGGGAADTIGADGPAAPVTGIASGPRAGTVGQQLAGEYGTIVMNADGSYTYVVDNRNPAVAALGGEQTLAEVFTYTITDADGDTATATLTITIHGETPPPKFGDQIFPQAYVPETRGIGQSYTPALFVHYAAVESANEVLAINGRILGDGRIRDGEEIEGSTLQILQDMTNVQHVSADGVSFSRALLLETENLNRVADTGMLVGDSLFNDFSPFGEFESRAPVDEIRTARTDGARTAQADAGKAEAAGGHGDAAPIVVSAPLPVSGEPHAAPPEGAHSLSARLAALARERVPAYRAPASAPRPAAIVRVSPSPRS